MSDITLKAAVWFDAKRTQLSQAATDENGLETVEWVAMIGVAMALLGAVATVFGGDSKVGNAAVSTLSTWISNLAK